MNRRKMLRTTCLALAAGSALPALQSAEGADFSSGLTFLTRKTRELLQGCRVRAGDGTWLYTPDGKGNYRALWTRDFTYMVENAGDAIPLAEMQACIRFLLRGQREDGALPDRVRPDGQPVYVAGPEGHPLGKANLDNPMFMVIAVDEYLNRLPGEQRPATFQRWHKKLDHGLDWVPRGARGLVFNDPVAPHSPYGFTDTVGKTGELLFESALYWTACRRMASWHEAYGEPARARTYRKRADAIERGVGTLWDEDRGAFVAATGDCRQIDIWGNAYLLAIGVPLGDKRDRVVRFLVSQYDRYAWRGQIRHLLEGEHWERLLTPVPEDRYQNGAYWATASGWVMQAVANEAPALAGRIFRELIEDFRANGICECINEGYRQLPSYVVSAANPLAAARRLGAGPRR